MVNSEIESGQEYVYRAYFLTLLQFQLYSALFQDVAKLPVVN